MENYVAIDLEMTGLNAKRDTILEIGAVKVANKKVVEEFQVMIHPHMKLPLQVVQLTGITDEMAAQGDELGEVFPKIVEFCADLTLLGHNIMFDYSFLKQAATNQNLPFEHAGVDTLKIARSLLPKEQKKTLQALGDFYAIQREHRHRALDDARLAMELYEIFEREYGAQQPALFAPAPLLYKTKKQQPASERQKKRLKELADYHQVALQVPWESLTKNEASRQIDKIIGQYGRMPKVN